MSLGMLIIMIIKDQYSFDNFHKDSDRIYRVNTRLLHPEWGSIDFASAPLPIGQALKDDYSFSENTVRVNRELNGDATYKNVNVPVKGLYVDPSFLEVFNFPLPLDILRWIVLAVILYTAATMLYAAFKKK